MNQVVSAFYWPTVMWTEYPVLSLLPVVGFGVVFRHLRRTGRARRVLLVVTVFWLVYAVYEGVMYAWALRVIAAIRIDLIVLGPACTSLQPWAW